MTPQALKNSILQRAIQGKLVEQRKEEGTAVDLLKEIHAEKERLIKEKKIKKSKPLPEINDDEKPFDIPETWKWVRLGAVVHDHGQIRPKEIFTYIDIGSINNVCQKLGEKENIIIPENAPSRARKIIKKGDIIYSTVRPYLHNVCIIDKDFTHMPIASTGFAVMATYHGILVKYLFYYLLSPEFDSYVNSNKNSKGVAYPAINDKALYQALIALPPYDEQCRIVKEIESIVSYIDKYNRAYTQLTDLNQRFPEEMKKSLLQYAMQGKLVEQRPEEGTAADLLNDIRAEKERLIKEKKIKKSKSLPEITDDEKPFDIPDNWEWARLNDICVSIVDCPHSTPKYYLGDIGFKAIDTNCIDENGDIKKWRYVDHETYQKRVLRLVPKANDIVLTREGSIGRAAILPKEKICLGQRVMLLRSSTSINKKFLKYFLMSPTSLTRLTDKQKGLGAKHINVSDIIRLTLPVPPLSEQGRIVDRLERLIPLCHILITD